MGFLRIWQHNDEKKVNMAADFVVKTSSSSANRLLGGGFYSGDVQTVYSAAGAGIQVLLASAITDAISQELKTVYYDMAKTVSYEMLKANDIAIDGDLFSLIRRNHGSSIQSSLTSMVRNAELIRQSAMSWAFSSSMTFAFVSIMAS